MGPSVSNHGVIRTIQRDSLIYHLKLKDAPPVWHWVPGCDSARRESGAPSQPQISGMVWGRLGDSASSEQEMSRLEATSNLPNSDGLQSNS